MTYKLRGGPRVARRAALVGVLALLFLLPSGSAVAADRVVWKRQTIQESDGAWKISMEIHLGRAPNVSHIPFRFSFTPYTHFERALVDGKKDPVTRKIPLSNQQPIVEGVDAGFMDPASGKTAKRTRFSFSVTREHGFSAGQYEVEVTNSHSGDKLGGKVLLTLDGDNEVVDRRSIVFDDKKPSDEQASQEPKARGPKEKELTPDDEEFWEGGSRKPEEPTSPLPPPAHLQEKPGCGCRTAGHGGGSGAGLWGALLALGIAVLRRRAARC
jgi:MYXO-CTERM domain-containing protein